MKTIYKYCVGAGDVQMPAGAKILSVNAQDGELYLWAEVNTDQVLEHRTFAVFGTGWEIGKDLDDDERSYVGTVFEGALVWHVYEVLK